MTYAKGDVFKDVGHSIVGNSRNINATYRLLIGNIYRMEHYEAIKRMS